MLLSYLEIGSLKATPYRGSYFYSETNFTIKPGTIWYKKTTWVCFWTQTFYEIDKNQQQEKAYLGNFCSKSFIWKVIYRKRTIEKLFETASIPTNALRLLNFSWSSGSSFFLQWKKINGMRNGEENTRKAAL